MGSIFISWIWGVGEFTTKSFLYDLKISKFLILDPKNIVP